MMKKETKFFIDGLKNGFRIGYEGPRNVTRESKNIPFRQGICNKEDLWEKMMKEIKLKRFAGPFHKDELPFENYIQSPLGLVPKGEDQTRLIFHLSYEFGSEGSSINANTPREACSVKYKDLNYAMKVCLKILAEEGEEVIFWFTKSDLKSAFRLLRICPQDWNLLTMKVEDPLTGETFYFFDKCLPFGVSISCSHFQRFSDGLRHIFEFITDTLGKIPNYLDGFLFIAICRLRCNYLVQHFLKLCEELNIPVSLDKTEWASTLMTFLGILLDGKNRCLNIPEDMRKRALELLQVMKEKKSAKVIQLQQLAGLLNFLNKAIVPGRAFTRHMYAKFSGFVKINSAHNRSHQEAQPFLKQHHHIKLNREFKEDCAMWIDFLNQKDTRLAVLRPFADLSDDRNAVSLQFFSDASLSVKKGFGCYYDKEYTLSVWDPTFIVNMKPSIMYLELYTLCVAVFTWSNKLRNRRVIIACDNTAVVDIVNNLSSSCKNGMFLICLLTLRSLIFNFRVFARYLTSEANDLADTLSRGQMQQFFRLASSDVKVNPEPLAAELWPMSRL